MTDLNDKLLPCAFCGSTPVLNRIGNDHTKSRAVRVKCSNVQCRVERTDKALSHGIDWLQGVAIKNWNRRTPAPQAAPSDTRQPMIGRLLDEFSSLPVLWGLNEPGALTRHSDVFKMLVAVGKEYAVPAAPLTQAADQSTEVAQGAEAARAIRRAVRYLEENGCTGPAADLKALLTTPAAPLESFKNFHRSLCARFGYTHDEKDWQRDLVSLEEHIAARLQCKAKGGDPAEPHDDSDMSYDRPVGYVSSRDLNRLNSGHDATLRSAKFGPSPLDEDVPVFIDLPDARPAPLAQQSEPWEGFDVERTGDAHYDAGNFLLNAAQEFWQSCRNVGQCGAVQWVTGSNGELLIYTRGEYRETLMENIDKFADQPVKHFAAPLPAQQASERDAKDAARYRWFRACSEDWDQLDIVDGRGNLDPEALDREIDAALAAMGDARKGGGDA